MSTSSIFPSLSLHPSRVFSQWYSSVSAFAASIGTADFRYGLVHLVISPQAWAALPGNTAQNGDVAAVPDPQPPGTLAGNASAATVHLYREDSELHRRYLGYVSTLRAAILESLGPEIQISLRDPQHNIIVLSIPQIMTTMRDTYGTAAAADIEALLARLSEPIQGGDHDSFVSFTVGFRQTVAALDRAGQPLSQYLQCRRLQEATASQSNIARAVSLYFETNPLLADQSLAELIPFVLRQLQNASVSSIGYANSAPSLPATPSPPSDILSSMDTIVSACLAAMEASGLSKRNRQSRSNRNSATTGPRAPGSVAHPSRQYCYHHGFGGHSSGACNFMRGSPVHTAAMRAATTPNEVPGGHP